LNLATGGDFSNPLLERAQFPGPHHYFGHPPLYSYAIAGWLKIFGISAWSLTAFQMLMYLLICRATLAIFQRHRFPPLLEWLLPLAVAPAFLPIGLRFESLSIALTMLGFALIDCGNTRLAAVFLGLLLMFLGASTASRVTVFSGGLLALTAVNLWRQNTAPIKLCIIMALAFLGAFGLFLWMIHFHLAEFWHNYLFVASGRSGGPIVTSLKHYLFDIQGITCLPTHLLWVVALPFFWCFRDRELSRIGIFASMPVFLLVLMGALNDGAVWYIFFALFVAVAAGCRQLPRFPSWTVQIIFALALLAANGRYGMDVVGLLSGEINDRQTAHFEEARALKSTPRQTVLIDQETARYVFDYRIPPGFLDWNYSTPFPGSVAIESPPHPGDVYMVGPHIVKWINQKSLLNLQLPQWKPLGSERWSYDKFPKTILIIDPQDCAGLPGVAGHQDSGQPRPQR